MTALPKPKKENIGKFVYDLVWSGDFMPMIGDTVGTPQHGPSVVTGYFTEDGFLGVQLDPIDPPDWWLQQRTVDYVMLFGIEIKQL